MYKLLIAALLKEKYMIHSRDENNGRVEVILMSLVSMFWVTNTYFYAMTVQGVTVACFLTDGQKMELFALLILKMP